MNQTNSNAATGTCAGKQPAPINPSVFDALSDSAYIREAQLVASPKRPGVPSLLPFSAPTLWRKVKAGSFPAPIKLSERVTCWEVRAIREWMREQVEASYIPTGKRDRSALKLSAA